MIFTTGHTESYERYFQEQSQPKKKGKRPGYIGGSVFQTQQAAEAQCFPGYSVYGVLAEWGVDTAPSHGGPWHDLLIDAPLVRISGENVR